jgi:TDG/mug DNA glycosylase family protein
VDGSPAARPAFDPAAANAAGGPAFDPAAGSASGGPAFDPAAGSAAGGLAFDPAAEPGGWAGLPVALARLHLAVPVGAAVRCSVPGGYPPGTPPLPELVAGAGFVGARARRAGGREVIEARRDRTLPDFVGPGMRMLVCGLNPSLVAADAGFGYAGATNRFWAVAVAAGVVTRPREPLASLAADGVGMTDLVKRATPNADGLTPAEYRAGLERVGRLVEWLRPGVVVFVGLAGWRAAVDRRAGPGPQPAPFGGAPAYVMPSTSGRNARTTPAELADHLRRALALADAGP